MILFEKSLSLFNIFLIIVLLQENFQTTHAMLLQQGKIEYPDFVIGEGENGKWLNFNP